jgi:alpha-ketoglutarate-dependent taurine dioxygenase
MNLEKALQDLSEQGYAIISNVPNKLVSREVLAYFGTLMPQYNQELEYDVKSTIGYEKYQYTKSKNYISPHTEAPDLLVPPHYLALYCIKQAQCGGGETQIYDGHLLMQALSSKTREYFENVPVKFVGGNVTPGDVQRNHYYGMCYQKNIDFPILRFSYNYFNFNNVHGFVEDSPEAMQAEQENQDQQKKLVSKEILTLFMQNAISILIPEQAILIWNNHRMLHARSKYQDVQRHLVRYWLKKKGG